MSTSGKLRDAADAIDDVLEDVARAVAVKSSTSPAGDSFTARDPIDVLKQQAALRYAAELTRVGGGPVIRSSRVVRACRY